MQWVGRWAIACTLAACGRIAFDPLGPPSATGDSGAPGEGGDGGTGDGGIGDSDSGFVQPANDLCANAIDVSAGGTFAGTTCGAADEYTNTCFAAGAPDVWYVVVRGSGGGIINYFFAIDSGFVTKTGTGMCGDTTLTNCRITQIASQGNMIYPVVVERETGDCGPYTLQVTIQ